jgi:hypothetical protein
VDKDAVRVDTLHRQEVERVTALVKPRASSRINLTAPDAYAWTLYHLLQNETVIKEQLFPITYYQANGATWVEQGRAQAKYFDIGISDYRGSVDDRALSLIADWPPMGLPHKNCRLLDMAVVIRSKDAGINRLTFDIIFNSAEQYTAALRSNVFHKGSVAQILGLPVDGVVGTFFVDSCNAIKISIDRPNISASLDERDVFGAQHQSRIEELSVPVYVQALSKASTF